MFFPYSCSGSAGFFPLMKCALNWIGFSVRGWCERGMKTSWWLVRGEALKLKRLIFHKNPDPWPIFGISFECRCLWRRRELFEVTLRMSSLHRSATAPALRRHRHHDDDDLGIRRNKLQALHDVRDGNIRQRQSDDFDLKLHKQRTRGGGGNDGGNWLRVRNHVVKITILVTQNVASSMEKTWILHFSTKHNIDKADIV